MVEECAHLFPDGRKCHRIPKHGQKFCPSHRSHGRRLPFQEDDDFLREILAFNKGLDAMTTEGLLAATMDVLSDIHAIIDRRSRRHRMAFARVLSATTITAERLEEDALRRSQPSTPGPQPQSQPTVEPLSKPLLPETLSPRAREKMREYEALLQSKTLAPNELGDLIEEVISILESDAETSCTLDSNA